MNIRLVESHGHPVAVVESDAVLISDPQSALDLFMTILFEHGVSRIVLAKSVLSNDFFDLSTRMAGEVLQKVVNYHLMLAIYGDFSHYGSRALRDFIHESNSGRHVFFVADEAAALDRLGRTT